ncbi:hypothetical protein HMPREF0380_00881 [Eubacterium infirmum F0142]|nr:hypothetical protein HMPREF0380_00881 [Eubacterium infirmum F0142]
MNVIRNLKHTFKYSLHDAKVNTIEVKGENLVLNFDYIFSYDGEGEHKHNAKLVFEDADIEDMNILVFNDTLYEQFSGKKIELDEYLINYEDSKFEIITETYNWGTATFQGWLWTGDKPAHCIMELFFRGDMLYILDEE